MSEARATVEVVRRSRRRRPGADPGTDTGAETGAETGTDTSAATGAGRRARRAGGAGVGRLVATEFLRLATGRWQLAGLGVVLAIHLGPLLLWGPQADPGAAWDGLRSRAGFLLAYAMMFFAVITVTAEYRYRTVTQTWLIAPRRARVLTAQVLTVAVLGLALGTLMFAAWWVAGAVRHGAAAMRSDRPLELFGAYVIVVTMVCAAAVTGVAVGTMTRGSTPALGALALCGLVEAALDGARFHGPVTAPLGVLLWPTTETELTSLLASLAWTAVLLAAAGALLRRDLPS